MPRRILWVDDQPANNAFEIARLKDDSVDVIEATSTDDLIQQARTAGVAIPIFVYSSARGIGTVRDDVLGVGGTGVTASTVELFEMLRQVLPAAA